MKKILCALIAVTAMGFCLAGCFVNHNDGKCDECKSTLGVVRYNEETELCPTHAAEKFRDEIEKQTK